MDESFEDKVLRVHQRLLDLAKTLSLDFVNIDIDTECVASGHVSLRIRVNKSQEQLVAEKLMEEPLREGYVKPGVYVVESDCGSVIPGSFDAISEGSDHEESRT